MDAAALKSLLWLIIWGVLFFVTMRYGCGAHIGGHRHRGREGPRTVKDPVCGMSVDPQLAAAAAVYRRETYYFCSATCRDRFEQTPEKYLVLETPGPQPSEGHHRG